MSVLAKPPYGAPCNGCGQCCEDQLCPLGQIVFRMQRGPCPALRYVDMRSSCGLVDEPRSYARTRSAMNGSDAMSVAAKILIGVGHGCDALADGEKDDPEARARMIASCHARPDEERQKARRLWGVR